MNRLAGLVLMVLASSAFAQGDWPMERHDRYGTARIDIGPASYTQPWILRKLPAEVASHGPALGVAPVGFYTSWVDERVYRFNAITGDLLGSFTGQDWNQCTPAISVDQNRVYVTTVKPYSFSPPGRLFAINVATMDYDWVFTTNFEKQNDFDSCSPVLGPDGDIVVGSTSGTVWRVDDVTGLPVWTRSGLGGVIHTCAFTRDDTTVVASNGSNVTGINYLSGLVLWTRSLGSTAGAPAVSTNGIIVVGSEGGTIYGLNPANGNILWTRGVLGPVRPAPAFNVDGSVAYVASDDQRLYAIRVIDGIRLWSYVSGAQNRNAPSVGADGRIYFGVNGTLHSVNSSGSAAWTVTFNGAQFRGPVSIGSNGTVYCGLNAGPSFLALVSQQPTTITPSAVAVTNGSRFAGDVTSLFTGDDSYYIGEVGLISNPPNPNIRMNVDFTSPTRGLSKLTVEVEASASMAVPQRIRLFNYVTNQFETLTTTMANLSDASTTVVVTTNPTRFVNQSSKNIRVELGFADDNPNVDAILLARVDKVSAILEPTFEN